MQPLTNTKTIRCGVNPVMDEMTGLEIGEGSPADFGALYSIGSPHIDWDYLDTILAAGVKSPADDEDD